MDKWAVVSAREFVAIEDPGVAGHVALALSAHVAELRRQGYEAEWRRVLALRDACLALNRSGQSWPNGGPGFAVVETVAVQDVERPAFVDYATAGRMLGCSARTVRRRVREGVLPAGGPSKRSMIAVVDLERYQLSLRSKPNVSAAASTDSNEGPPAAVESPAVPFHPPTDGFLSSSYATCCGRSFGEAMRNLGAVERAREDWWRNA